MTTRSVVRALVPALVAVGVLATSSSASAAAPKTCNGEKALCSRTLDKVVLATTHNSMSAASLGWGIPNQQVGIPDQLKAGVHGLLFDTHYGYKTADGKVADAKEPIPGGASKDVYLCHESCGIGATLLKDVLSAMAKHIKKNPNNVFVIVNEDYVTPKDFATVVKSSGLLKYVYPGKATGKWPTLSTMIQKQQQVVILSEGHSGVKISGIPWYHLAYDGTVQETPYSWDTAPLIVDPANWAASCVPNRGGTKGKLFLMNHWAPTFAPTPAGSEIVNATAALVGRAKECKSVRGKLPNLVAVDMFKSGGLFAAVKQLNALK